MKNILIYIIASILTLIPIIVNCTEQTKEEYIPIEECTDGKSIDKFLTNLKLDKVNKIVLKVELEKDRRKTETRTEITDIKRVRWLISSFKKVNCMDESFIYDNPNELWLYENDKLLLKVTLFTTYKKTKVKFYNPDKFPAFDYKLGSGEFIIKNDNLSTWYDELIKENHGITEAVQIELDLIEDCLREFINLNSNNPDYWGFEATTETLEGRRQQTEFGYRLGKWSIEKVDSQEPIASYSYSWLDGQNITTYTLFLTKQNGVYKVKDYDNEGLFFLDDFLEGLKYGSGTQ